MNSLLTSSLYAKTYLVSYVTCIAEKKDFINLEDEIIDKSLIKSLIMEIDPLYLD